MIKVWNITDDPRTEVAPTTLFLFGVTVPPGNYVSVPESRLVNAHKTKRDLENELIHIGPSLPEGYLRARSHREEFPHGHNRAHGPDPIATSHSETSSSEEAEKEQNVSVRRKKRRG